MLLYCFFIENFYLNGFSKCKIRRERKTAAYDKREKNIKKSNENPI